MLRTLITFFLLYDGIFYLKICVESVQSKLKIYIFAVEDCSYNVGSTLEDLLRQHVQLRELCLDSFIEVKLKCGWNAIVPGWRSSCCTFIRLTRRTMIWLVRARLKIIILQTLKRLMALGTDPAPAGIKIVMTLQKAPRGFAMYNNEWVVKHEVCGFHGILWIECTRLKIALPQLYQGA